jgi:MraZ protein
MGRMKLRGNCPAKVDEKGRLKVPAPFLEVLKEYGSAQFYITSLNGKSARIYPLSVWTKKEEQLSALEPKDPANQAKRKILLWTSYYGQQVEIDGQGRLLLPGLLRDEAKLTAEVDVLGALDFLEVMNHVGVVDKLKNEPVTDDELNLLG